MPRIVGFNKNNIIAQIVPIETEDKYTRNVDELASSLIAIVIVIGIQPINTTASIMSSTIQDGDWKTVSNNVLFSKKSKGSDIC